MEWDHFNQFVDPDSLQGDPTVPPPDLAWYAQPSGLGGQGDLPVVNPPIRHKPSRAYRR